MKQIKDTFFIVVGNMICSLGIGTIALRLGLSLGGVSGLAKVLHGILPISISILVLAVNLILFALAYFFVGKKFAMNSFLSVILFPVFLEIALFKRRLAAGYIDWRNLAWQRQWFNFKRKWKQWWI